MGNLFVKKSNIHTNSELIANYLYDYHYEHSVAYTHKNFESKVLLNQMLDELINDINENRNDIILLYDAK